MVLKTCPKCKTKIEEDRADCKSCGIIFEKYLARRRKMLADAMKEICNDSLRNASVILAPLVQSFPESANSIRKLTDSIAFAYVKKDSGKLDQAELLFRKIGEKQKVLNPAVEKEIQSISESIKEPSHSNDLATKPAMEEQTSPQVDIRIEQDPNTDTLLTNCPACNKTVSLAATSCPHCGQPLKTKPSIPVSISGLRTSLLSGLGGIALLAIGVFCPILSAPIVGDINYFRNGEGDGTIVLIMAGISLLRILVNRMQPLLYTGLGSLAILAFTFFNFYSKMREIRSDMDTDLAGNPFRGLADMAMQSVQMQWGWGVLIVGSGLLIAAGLLEKQNVE